MSSHDGDGQDAETRVLLVDDDPTIVGPLSRLLRREGFLVHAVGTGAEALRALARRPQLVILDLGLPDTDGLDVCRQLRASGHRMPVLVLSARAGQIDIIVGMDAGANDYLTKPFRFARLLGRIWAVLAEAADD